MSDRNPSPGSDIFSLGMVLFEALTGVKPFQAEKVTTWLKYEAAETIITEGEIEDCFYIIVSGEVRVFKRGKPLAILKAGDCFGEMAYLGNMTRTATIQAIKDTVLMKVNASIIDQTSTNTQFRFYKVFSSTLIERLTRTSERLSTEI